MRKFVPWARLRRREVVTARATRNSGRRRVDDPTTGEEVLFRAARSAS
jgi:hypothetical protein